MTPNKLEQQLISLFFPNAGSDTSELAKDTATCSRRCLHTRDVPAPAKSGDARARARPETVEKRGQPNLPQLVQQQQHPLQPIPERLITQPAGRVLPEVAQTGGLLI